VGRETSKLTPWSWQGTGAVCCFGGGILLAIVGSLLTAVTWVLGGALHPLLRGLGTFFLFVTIPLLILAGYCLDWLEETASEKTVTKTAKSKLKMKGGGQS
jgi:hypothetical protein